MSDETGWFKSDSGILWEIDLPLNPIFEGQVRRGQLTRVNRDGSPYANEEDFSTEEKPPLNANKAAWVDFAVSQGEDREEMEQLTKAQIAEMYGG